MSICGIIAEYNPFHLGHAYQIRQLKEQRGVRGLVVIMSGSFVQRGEPAVVDKYRRCAMALEAGADLVLELPPVFATGSAELFAQGGIALLEACGFVDELAFGASCTEMDALIHAAEMTERADASPRLGDALKQGLSYPAALNLVLEEVDPAAAALLQDPNNLLGVEYIKALKKQSSSIRPFALQRQGAAYGEKALPQTGFASATALRAALKAGQTQEAAAFMPGGCLEKMDYLLFPEDISCQLSAVLLRLVHEGRDLTAYADVSGDLAGSIRGQTPFTASFPELAESIASRRYTLARVRRALLHILLDIRKDAAASRPHSLKILGLRGNSGLPALLKQRAKLPVITKLADADPGLAAAYVYPQQLYNQAVFAKTGRHLPDDYQQSPLVWQAENDCILS